jgi:hypothetical protein
MHFFASGLREYNLRQSLFDKVVESIFSPTDGIKGGAESLVPIVV